MGDDKKRSELEEIEEIETLDFDADEEVSNQIDEMLDFIDISEEEKIEKIEDNKKQLDELLEAKIDDKKIEIDASKDRILDYKPSLKDLNIKSAKTRKIVKKAMLYVIIIMLVGFEFFINKTGEVLNDLRVYASDNQPIRIVQNEKYGYIDYTGGKIVNPKFTYGENFVDGYAIVKNSSNLPLIIDKGGKEAVPTGNYFSLYRAGSDIIASKVTKKGLKYGVLSSSLRQKVPFEYDNISFLGDVYTFVDGNTVGLINMEGKRIFDYKLTDKDDKIITVNQSKITDGFNQLYGVVTINSSSQIVNLKDGTVVSAPTLNEITPLENNVFYETINNETKKYIYVQDNKVLVESENYSNLSIDSINSGVLKAITNSYKYEYISTKTLEQVKKGLSPEEVYYGENIFMYKNHDYRKNKDSIVMIKNGEVIKTLEENFTIKEPFKNGIAIVQFNDGGFGYLNENGELINNERYTEAASFDSYGNAIAKTSGGYGVLDKNGKTIIPFENSEIIMAPAKVKKQLSRDANNAFYAVKKDTVYKLYNYKGKAVNDTYYDKVVFDENFPLVKLSTEYKDILLTLEDLNEIELTSFNNEYKAFENYIILKNEYYNYNGKLIYVDNSYVESGDKNE